MGASPVSWGHSDTGARLPTIDRRESGGNKAVVREGSADVNLLVTARKRGIQRTALPFDVDPH